MYSDERLSVRTELFFKFSLPLLARAASDHAVIHVLSYSASLPTEYLERLQAAAEMHEFLRLNECEDGQLAIDPTEVLRSEYPEQDLVFAEYRLDDDDLLAADFFDQLRPYVTLADVGRYVSLASGLTALFADGGFYDVRVCRQPMVAIGLARICRISKEGVITAPPIARHTVADTAAPVVLDSRRPAYLWTRHAGQDTAVVHTSSSTKREREQRLRQGLDRLSPVTDWAAVERHFPGVASRMTAVAFSGEARTALIVKRTRLSRDNLDLEVPGLAGRLQFETHIRSASPAGSRDALMVFHFVDAHGRDALPAVDAVSSSHVKVVMWAEGGPSRLAVTLRTSSGLASTRGELEVPEGMRLVGVTLRPAGERFSTGFLERLDLTSVAK